MKETRFRSGMLVFPNLTQLDLTGPYEVLARLPDAETLLLWKALEPVRSEHGLTILPTATFNSCPTLDLVFVPGGPGINPLLEDAEVLAFLRCAASEARPSWRSAPARWCSEPQDYCVRGAPRVIGCHAICCARSAPSRSPSASSSTANSSPAAASPPGSTWR